MNKSLPDKWVRKAVSDLVDGINVNGETISVYDTKVTGADQPDFYVIMSSQTDLVDKSSKCEHNWDSEILLDVRATYERSGNPGSRVQADDTLDAIRDLVKDIQLDVASGLSVTRRTFAFPNDLSEIDNSTTIYRKFLRMTLFIQ